MTDEVATLRDALRRLVRGLGLLHPGYQATGVTWAECHALQALDRRGSATMGQLGGALGADRRVADAVATALADAGWAERGDGRRARVELTDEGRQRLDRLHELADDQVGQALEILDDTERATVLAGVTLLAGALARTRRPVQASDVVPTEIVLALRRGLANADVAAGLEALLAAHRDRVYATCLAIVHDPARAAELTQDTLLRAIEKLPTFRAEASFSTWITGIARFEALNARRAKAALLTEDGVLDPADPTHSVFAALARHEQDAMVRAAAEAVLDPIERQAIALRYDEQRSLDDITAALELDTASGARGLLQRCRRKLAPELRRRLGSPSEGTSAAKPDIS